MRLHITEIEGIKTFDFNLYGFVYFGVNEYGIIVDIKYNELQILDTKEQIHHVYGYDIIKKEMKNMITLMEIIIKCVLVILTIEMGGIVVGKNNEITGKQVTI